MRAARAGVKSADAFRTISEVSGYLDVPQHVLRFWESKFPQVRPLKRGGGRRYYRPEDVVLLGRIRSLLYDEGYTIRGVQRLLKERKVTAKADSLGGVDGSAAPGKTEQGRTPGSETGIVVPPNLAPPPPDGDAARADRLDRDTIKEVIEELEGLRDRLRLAAGRG